MPELNFVGYSPTSLTDPIFPLTDPSMTIWHKALWRFYQLPQADRAVGTSIANAVPGASAATVSAGPITSGTTSKGLVMTGGLSVTLPSTFDLHALPTGRAIVVSLAITPDAGQSGVKGIVGKWSLTNAVQWALFYNSGTLQLQMQNGGAYGQAPASIADGNRHLLTLHFKAQGTDGTRIVDIYDGTAKVASTAGAIVTSSDAAVIGGTAGALAAAGKVHTLQLFTPPVGYDPADWIAGELAKINSDLA